MAWRNWFHVTTHTYGSWLRGDPRGWRERDHRFHVVGNRRKSEGVLTFQRALLAQSQQRLKHPSILFSPQVRGVVGELLLESFRIQNVSVLALAVGSNHVHALLQTATVDAKVVMSKAKQNVTRAGLAEFRDVMIWAQGSHVRPIRDRVNGVSCFEYIGGHLREGAWVWSYRDSARGG